MKSILFHSLAVLLLFQTVSLSEGTLCPLLRAAREASSEKTGSYIVVLKEETSHEMYLNIKAQVELLSTDQKLHGYTEKVAKAFTVRLTDFALNIVRSLPQVEYIEEETMAHCMQMNESDSVIWHVDRLDQHHLPLDNIYQPNGTGEGVDIYILDTGINYDHEEFEGRAEYGGYDAVDVNNNEHMQGRDCRGHGTHVASLAAGKTYGTAKNATLFSIRVLDCDGNAPWSLVIDGFEYLAEAIPERGRPAVVSISIAGSHLYTVDRALISLHNLGITVVAAAGNSNDNACDYSPASSSHVIAVGGSAEGDGLYRNTNVGSCVDIFAPGADIVAAGYKCNTCTTTLSGTSMATPKVSGIAAIHFEKDPDLTPDEMKEKITSTATPDVLDFTSIPSSHRSSTPNLLLYIGPAAVSIDCEEPKNIINGAVLFSGVTPGSIATYSCSSGYTLVGKQNRTCHFLGNWSYEEPQCLKVCRRLSYDFPDGYIFYSLFTLDEFVDEGTTVNYRCNFRYFLLGPESRICRDGSWSGEEPKCSPQCRSLFPISNGKITGNLEERTEGTVITYNCDEGFALIGPKNRTCTAGLWSGYGSVCVPVPPPPQVQALCSVVVWHNTDFPCENIISYNVLLYSSLLEDQGDLIPADVNRTYYIVPDKDHDFNTYVKVRAVSKYNIEGEWSRGIPLGCDPPIATEAPKIHNVYFELNGRVYYNNSAISMQDIGEGRSALLCKTNKLDCCHIPPNRYGQFYYPNGSQVPIRAVQQGFYRNRGEQLIRLNKRKGMESPPGKYRCEIPTAAGEVASIYITLTM